MKLKAVVVFIACLVGLIFNSAVVSAAEVSKMGIHILGTHELTEAKELIAQENTDQWHFITVPLTLDDLERREQWEQFFREAKKQKVIPLVRLATRVEGDHWVIPTRKDIVDQLTFLSQLEWPTEERHIIIFNEVNHAKEWGGTLNPAEYSQKLRFASDWAKSEEVNFTVLPAAMDLAAPSGRLTMEAFAYLEAMRSLTLSMPGTLIPIQTQPLVLHQLLEVKTHCGDLNMN
jgi:hypothetical protein